MVTTLVAKRTSPLASFARIGRTANADTDDCRTIDHYVLRADEKELPPIFRIPQLVRNTTYVSNEFIARVNECKLTGFRFQPLP